MCQPPFLPRSHSLSALFQHVPASHYGDICKQFLPLLLSLIISLSLFTIFSSLKKKIYFWSSACSSWCYGNYPTSKTECIKHRTESQENLSRMNSEFWMASALSTWCCYTWLFSISFTKKASPFSPSFMCKLTGSPLISMSTCEEVKVIVKERIIKSIKSHNLNNLKIK